MHTENHDAPLEHPRTTPPATSWFASATPPTTPIVGGIGSGKSAAIGIQRPDAALLDGPARDNVRHHAALTPVSPDDALMTFVSSDDGFADLYPPTGPGEQR